MDANRLDFWARALAKGHPRRETVGLLALSLTGLGPHSAHLALGNQQKNGRCRHRGERCGSGRRCCRGQDCVEHTCCPDERVFVECDLDCLCRDNPDFCCAGTRKAGLTCQGDDRRARELCCPAQNVCGDVCCDPVTQRCEGGECVCKAEFSCGGRCCPAECQCDDGQGVCVRDGDPNNCPSGAGGFERVRRAPLPR